MIACLLMLRVLFLVFFWSFFNVIIPATENKYMSQEIRRALGRGSHLYFALRRVATLTCGSTKKGGWQPLGAEFRFGTCLFKCLQRKPWWIVWKLRRTATQVSASSSDQTGEHLDG